MACQRFSRPAVVVAHGLGYYKRIIQMGLVLIGLATLVTTLENEINARLGINAFAFGIGFSALMAGRLPLQVPLGRLSNKYARILREN